MSISNFFNSTLGAHLSNSRWSWGAFNRTTNQLFLRVWQDSIETVNGAERVHILRHDWEGKSAGFPERKRHIAQLREGATGYGVVCVAADVDGSGSRQIAKFDDETLLQFGELIDEENRVFAQVISRIPVAELSRRQTAFSTVVPDLKSIAARNVDITTRETIANARVGQGIFRSHVLSRWNSSCSVTRSTTLDAIRASHIKPWCECDDTERLDPHNGLPLIATLDALFDAGLITFAPGGQLVVSKKVSSTETNLLGLGGARLRQEPSSETENYLDYHRSNVFRNA